MTPMFRWSGTPVGFFTDGWFFDCTGRYLGWFEADGSVWKADGVWLGQVIDSHYVLRDQRATARVRRSPKVAPLPPSLPRSPASRLRCVPRPGWVDALDEIGRVPTRDDLIGVWRLDESTLTLAADGRFTWSVAEQPTETGEWTYRGHLIIAPAARAGRTSANAVYRIIEFTRDTLTLRWLTLDEHSLLLTLRRA